MRISGREELNRVRHGEQGDIMIVTAVIVMLLLLFVFVYQFQATMTHAAYQRGQRAFDYGVSNGLVGLPGAKVVARITANTAEDVFANRVQSTGGRFSEITLPANDSMRVVLPKYGIVSDPTSTAGKIQAWDKSILGTSTYPAATDSLAGSEQASLRQILFGSGGGAYAAFDPAAPMGGNTFTDQIDDFGNAIAIYARFSPWRTFSLTPFTPEVEIASIGYIQPAMVYMLVDTMFSMDNRNALSTFGSANYEDELGNSDPTHLSQWPLQRMSYTMGAWDYESIFPADSDYGMLSTYPQNGQLFCCAPPFPCGACDVPTATAYKQTVREFFFPLCRSAPFYQILLGSVGLLDAFQRISSTASTTSVGLLPPYMGGVTDPVIPIHPASQSGGVWRHVDESSFPLPFRTGVDPSNQFLHRPKAQAFHGWVSVDSPTNPVGAEPPVSPAAGVDIPSLCIGRGIATGTSSNTLLPFGNDIGALNPQTEESPELTHGAEGNGARRLRADSATSWCSDQTSSGAQGYSDLSLARSAETVEGLAGETARNLLAQQCMMIQPLNFHRVGKFTWTKPNNNTLRPLPRHAAPSLKWAADYLRDATDNYNNNSGGNPYSRIRRIDDDQVFLIMSLYGPYNEEGVQSYLAANASVPNAAAARAAMADEFIKALSYALCGREDDSTPAGSAKTPIKVILAFHPMNEDDRNAVGSVQSALGNFTDYFSAQAEGTTPPTSISGCNDNVKVANLYYVAIDYEGMEVDPSITGADDIFREQVLKSSTLFMNMFPSIFVMPIVLRPGYSL